MIYQLILNQLNKPVWHPPGRASEPASDGAWSSSGAIWPPIGDDEPGCHGLWIEHGWLPR